MTSGLVSTPTQEKIMSELTFTYRLTQVTYRNRIEYEDGPGSLQNVVSDSSSHVIRVWENQGEVFGTWLLEDGVPGLSRGTPDGWIEYSYKLERCLTGDENKWKLVGFLEPQEGDDYDEW